MAIGGKMNWIINSYGLFHFHNPIYIEVTSTECPLCKEKTPNHFLLQKKILGLNPAIYKDYIDFCIPIASDFECGNWNYYHIVTRVLHIEQIKDTDQQEEILKLFKQFIKESFHVEYPTKD